MPILYLVIMLLASSVFAERPIRVLSLDGGGIKGLTQAVILAKMEEELDKPISEIFDLIAGTSIGGVMALGLSVPDENNQPKFKASDFVRLFTQQSSEVFSASMYHKISTAFGLLGPKYETIGFENLLEEYLGDTRLSQALVPVLITGYHVEGSTGIEFSSKEAHDFPTEKDCLMREVGLATAAAPVFFDLADVNYSWGTIKSVADGALYSSNPALLAYVNAKRLYPNRQIEVVSLGTGNFSAEDLGAQLKGRGALHWLSPMFRHVIIGDMEANDTILHKLLNEDGHQDFYRLNISVSREHRSIDDSSEYNLNYLVERGEAATNTTIFKEIIKALQAI